MDNECDLVQPRHKRDIHRHQSQSKSRHLRPPPPPPPPLLPTGLNPYYEVPRENGIRIDTALDEALPE